MTSIDEKRVYNDREGTVTVYVATELGVVRVEISGDIVGEFSMAHRCVARDVATVGDSLAVATDEDALDSDFRTLGFGPTVAVGFDGDTLLAAGDDGTLARYDDGDDEWHELASLPEVRAIDGDMLATADGIYQIVDDGVRNVGLNDVRDVSTDGVPLAATAEGLYWLGNGWIDALDGDFRVVSSTDEDAYAAADALFVRDGDDWQEVALPVADPVAAIGFGEGVYVATESGTFLSSVGNGWRSRHLGLTGVRALSVCYSTSSS
ncbi:HVO_0234 family beta-propeller protein [Haladaptatus sp. DFWS20]|uniref:HVO_0234 family beta-propeller protein n=1 Tax=Haladaptatus sp. DFWS20 TaxID=3403467 RepID=UPI003EBD4B31